MNNLMKLRNELRKTQKLVTELRGEIRSTGKDLNPEALETLNEKMWEHLEKCDELRGQIIEEEAQRENDIILSRGYNEKAHEDRGGRKTDEYRSAFNNYLRSGYTDLSAEDKKVLSEFRALNTADKSLGGYVVDTETMTTVQEEKVVWGAIYAVTRKLRTQRGNAIEWPVSKEGVRRGVIIGEGQNHGKSETAFGTKTLGAHKLSSQIILVSDELLQDAFIDVAAYVTRIARQRVELGIDYYVVNGKGGEKEPSGLLLQIPKSQSVNVTLPAATDPKYQGAVFDAFIDVEHRVNPAYRKMPGFYRAINDKTLSIIRKWKDANGNPIYIRNPSADWPETLFGDKLLIDNELPDLGKNGAIVAGDFGSLIVREAGDMVIKRFNELYGETGQVGFLAWQRFGVILEDESAMAMAVFDGSGTDPVNPFDPMKTSQDEFDEEE